MLIGLCGFIGSGKDTVAKCLEKRYSFTRLAFAGPLKDIVANVFGWDREMIEGNTPASRLWREVPDEWWSSRLSQEITPRKMLQIVGTDMFRDKLSPKIWTSIIERQIRNAPPSQSIVVTDCRFEEEVQLIRQLGGTVVYVHRKDPEWKPLWDEYISLLENDHKEEAQVLYEEIRKKVHPSEFTIYALTPDAIIENISTIENLEMQVDILLDHLDPRKNA